VGGAPLKPARVLDSQWIMRERGSGTRSAFEEMLRFAGVDPDTLDVALTLPSNEAVRSAVLAGPYAAVVSELVVAAHIDAGLLCRAGIDLPPRAFYMLRHEARYKSRASLAMEALIRQVN